jgi:hypothetical protein
MSNWDTKSPRRVPHPSFLRRVGGFANCATAQFGLRSDCIGSKGRSSTSEPASRGGDFDLGSGDNHPRQKSQIPIKSWPVARLRDPSHRPSYPSPQGLGKNLVVIPLEIVKQPTRCYA